LTNEHGVRNSPEAAGVAHDNENGRVPVKEEVRILGYGATEALVQEMAKIIERQPPSQAYDTLVTRLQEGPNGKNASAVAPKARAVKSPA
jgi:hypothetical protein